MYMCYAYVCIYIYIYIYILMGGAPRNPAPRNHLFAWIVEPSGCHCTEVHLTSRDVTELTED